jgi:hypothetical protein
MIFRFWKSDCFDDVVRLSQLSLALHICGVREYIQLAVAHLEAKLLGVRDVLTFFQPSFNGAGGICQIMGSRKISSKTFSSRSV